MIVIGGNQKVNELLGPRAGCGISFPLESFPILFSPDFVFFTRGNPKPKVVKEKQAQENTL